MTRLGIEMKCGKFVQFHANRCGISKKNKQVFITMVDPNDETEYCPKCKGFHNQLLRTSSEVWAMIESNRSLSRRVTWQKVCDTVRDEHLEAAGRVKKTKTLNQALEENLVELEGLVSLAKENPEHAAWVQGGWLV